MLDCWEVRWPISRRPLAVYLAAMPSPQDPEELFDQMVPQLSQQVSDRVLSVATEYLACVASMVFELVLGLPHRDCARRKLESNVAHGLSMPDAPTVRCPDELIDVAECACGPGPVVDSVVEVLVDGQTIGLDRRSVAIDDAFMISHEVLRIAVEATHRRIDHCCDLDDWSA